MNPPAWRDIHYTSDQGATSRALEGDNAGQKCSINTPPLGRKSCTFGGGGGMDKSPPPAPSTYVFINVRFLGANSSAKRIYKHIISTLGRISA